MELNDAGRMAQEQWIRLPERFPNASLDVFVVMPNHLHGIISLHEAVAHPVGAPLVGALGPGTMGDEETRTGTRPAPTLGEVVGAFKSITTREYVLGVRRLGWPSFRQRVWQRNYYEHVIRGEDDLGEIRSYVVTNPMRWELDPENPQRTMA
jgi:REP element-mobilizing transposase RayT